MNVVTAFQVSMRKRKRLINDQLKIESDVFGISNIHYENNKFKLIVLVRIRNMVNLLQKQTIGIMMIKLLSKLKSK